MQEYEDFIKKLLEEYMLSEEDMTPSQKKIAEAALRLFAEKGFEASTTSEIAKAAGVAEGTIYKYFKTKKDLLFALVIPTIIRMAGPVLLRDVEAIAKLKDLNTEEVLERLMLNRLQLVQQNWAAFKVALQEMQYHPELKDALVSHVAAKGRLIVNSLLAEKVESGELRNLNLDSMTRVLVSLLAGYIFAKQMFSEEAQDWNDTEEIKLMVDIYLNGVKKRDQ